MITFTTHASGLALVSVRNKAASAEISTYGGHVLSYTPEGGENLLFLSKESYFTPGKPIRGGIPVCWPWFGPHKTDTTLPQHGFVRISQWRLVQTEETGDSTTVTLECVSTPETRALWPHDFRLTLAITVGRTLNLVLTTTNTGTTPFVITDALHTYFSIGDISRVSVKGLDGFKYLDRDGGAHKYQAGDITISGETDRVYFSGDRCVIADPVKERTISVEKTGFPDTVVWNPWAERAKAITDLGNDEYRAMICAEAGSVLDNAISVAAGVSVSQKMSLIPGK